MLICKTLHFILYDTKGVKYLFNQVNKAFKHGKIFFRG